MSEGKHSLVVVGCAFASLSPASLSLLALCLTKVADQDKGKYATNKNNTL